MKRNLIAETEFIYHNVGQGLFYTGDIKVKNAKFRFVYDCGSENKGLVNTSIHRFKQDFGADEIDLLIISHLHSDHISGLNKLLNNFAIKDVILPYFPPVERLLIALRRTNMPAWYYVFLSDPVTYLLERGVERVIILGGEEGGREDRPPEDIPPSPPEGEIKLNIEKLPDDKVLKKEISQNDENWNEYIGERLLIKNHNGYILALGLWIFRFFNYEIPPSVLHNFHVCISSQIINNEDIKRIIRDKNRLKALKSCYTAISKHLRNNLNNTSLVLYHGPVGNNEVETQFLFLNHYYTHCPFCYPCLYGCRILLGQNNNRFGQFLTGDIDVNMKYDELIRHYTNYLENVIIIQVPHHGAIKNWNKKIIDDIPDSELWIISAGLGNRYGHPSWRVINDLCFNRKKSIWVNEMNYMMIKGKIRW